MSHVIGIDLGTTNSVVAVLENKRPEVIQNAEGRKTTPSVVYFSDEDEVVVGELAARQAVLAPDRVIRSVKRFMGCRWDEVEERSEGIRYELAADCESMACVKLGPELRRPESVSAYTLRKMKETAEAFVGEEVDKAVITVPAHFNDSQRQATKTAAELAGLEPLRIINEPTAAALAYGLTSSETCELVAIFDFGGGTFDVTILEISGDIFEVRSTGGDTYLGGDNINYIFGEWLREKIKAATGIDPRDDLKAMQRIADAAETAKCELSTLPKTLVSLPYIVSDEEGPKHFNEEISRERFTELIAPVLEKLADPCVQTMQDAGITVEELTKVVLVGGSTRIPAVRQMAERVFGRKPDTSLNPDEVVACGAAIQGGIMSGDLDEVLLLDVSPLSLGIELADDVFSPIIGRNSSIPVAVAKSFTTCVDNQSVVNVHVLQGERRQASANRSLARFKLTDIPPAPKEIPEIEVMFKIDANGILTVSAMDLTSGQSQKIDVVSASHVGVGEAETIAEEAENAADADRYFMKKSALRGRMREMESELQELGQRINAGQITEDQNQRLKESFFKLDVALAQDEWEIIDAAERDAKAIYLEITSLLSLQILSDKPPEASLLDFGSGEGSN